MSRIRIEIENNGIVYEPVLCGKCSVETSRCGYAGNAVFSVLKDKNIDFTEGNEVKIYVNDKEFFKGYVFSKNRNKDGIITVKCYDLLRYLKNKSTYTFDYKKASDIVRIIAGDYGLKCGEIDDSGYIIQTRTEDNKTLLDIIQNAIDITYENTGKLYVLFDDFGKLCLKKAGNMVCDYKGTRATSEDFEYESSIDKNVYTRIKLTFKGRKGIIQEYVRENDDGISKWGVLQYNGTVEEGENGNLKAQQLLKTYGNKRRSLTIKGAFGDTSIRGGSIIYINFGDIGDIAVDEKMSVERVLHTFESGVHKMTLELRGGLIND